MGIAWRLQMLVRLGRTSRKPIQKEPPPPNAVIRIVASFGGFHLD
jgi:hypothetical protein